MPPVDAGEQKHVKPRTILEYLSSEMSTEELNQLYQDKFTVLTLFRIIPPLSKQYLMRLVILQPYTAIPRSTILSWHISSTTKRPSPINNESLQVLIKLKLLLKIDAQQLASIPSPPHPSHQSRPSHEPSFYFNPFFHKSLQSALTTTNPLQLHLSPFILPRLAAKLQAYQLSAQSPSKAQSDTHLTLNQQRTEAVLTAEETNTAAKSTGSSAITKLRFKKREPPSSTPTSQSTTENATTKPAKKDKNEQNQKSPINFAIPLPPICKGNTSALLDHITCNIASNSTPANRTDSTASSISSKLPLLDVAFLDTFAHDQINHISLYLHQLLPKTAQSLVYPTLPNAPTTTSSIGRVLSGITTFLIDLLLHNNFIQTKKVGNRNQLKISQEGLTFTLKPAQDRAWMLLLMYFDSIRDANKTANQQTTQSTTTSSKPSTTAMSDADIPSTTTTTTTSTITAQPSTQSSTTSIPSLSNVFQFIFHLSFAPLGTSIPVIDLHPDQLTVLFHLAEFGFLYPLYSTQIPPPPIKSTPNPETPPPSLTHGLLGFYPTRLLTNLSASLKSTTFLSLSDLSAQHHNIMEEFDDEMQSIEQIVASSSTARETPGGITHRNDGPIATSLSNSSGQLSITEKAYNELIQDLSTPAGVVSNPLKRFLVVETTLKVYAFTNNPLYLKILSHFVEFQVKLPNLCVGFITRHSVQKAIGLGISSEEIVTWLTQHAHERMVRNAMGEFDPTLQRYKNNRDIILPLTVVNQIGIWATEKDRFECHDAVMLDFKDNATFKSWQQKVLEYELQLKIQQLPPSRRPKTQEDLEHIDFSAIHLEPKFLLYSKSDKPTLILHAQYFDDFKALQKQKTQQASADGQTANQQPVNPTA